jgi:ketosteroid isomerase-like protein
MSTSMGDELPASRSVGDEVPKAVAAYYEAADGGRVDDAVAVLAPDVLVATQRPGGHEVDPRRILRGREAVREWLREQGRSQLRHDPVLCVTDGHCCMVEGLMRKRDTEEATMTYFAGFRIGTEGLERYLTYATEAVAAAPRTDDRRTGDARKAIDAYFAALARGHFEEAAAQFSEDVMYSHPPYRHTGITSNRRVVFNSRDELLTAFRERGQAKFRHRILEFIQRGPNVMFELVVEGLPDAGTGGSICSVGLDDEGRIDRYVANYTEPAVPQS